MWREPEYAELKKENRELLLQKKQEPKNYMDILSIIEHPAFIEFYDDLLKDAPVLVWLPMLSPIALVIWQMLSLRRTTRIKSGPRIG